MTITEESKHKAKILRLVGNFDFKARHVFNTAVENIKKDGAIHIILNLKGVPYLDSSGLGLLGNLENQLRLENKRASLVCLQEHVEKIILLARLEARFSICQTEEEALAGKPQVSLGNPVSSGNL